MNRPLAEATRIQSPDRLMPAESRAALISKSLRSIARRARTPRNVFVASGSGEDRRWHQVFVWAIVAGFGLIVVIPNLVTGIYLAFVASDQYATETQFAVRGGESGLPSQFAGLIGIPATPRVQDSLILTDYIRGRSMVDAIDKDMNLRRLFGRKHVDFLSRFNPKRSDEELMHYWRNHVDVNIDKVSGIITVVVRAFTPQDSLNLTNHITAQSEKLVNELTERSRSDALRQAQAELDRARQNLQEKTTAMRDLRNAEGVLDSGRQNEAMTKLMAELRLEYIHMQQEYAAQRKAVSADAPQMRVLEARIQSMKDQIAGVETQMTGGTNQTAGSLSKTMSRFDVAQLDKNIAEKQYIAAAAAYEHARIDLETQNVYLASFLKPVLAQEPLYPRRVWLWAIVAIISLLLWGGGVGTAVLVRNHLAV